MNTLTANFDAGMVNDEAEMATWNRPRTSEELQEFITSHHDRLPEGVEVE